MSPVRNNSPIDEALILDAARDRIIAVGLRRTTLTDIARHAGVSRMTIYRHWPEMSSLVGELMTREWTALFDGLIQESHGEHTRARIATGLAASSRTLQNHPMFRRIVELDPEILIPYLVDRLGSSQKQLRDQLTAQIALGQDDASIRREDPATLASGVLLILQGFTLSGATMSTLPDVLDRELSTAIDGYLRS